ncbi:hypothetical protein [Modestobacter italicus]|uniref:hypothetical protein n=1 Tax=Modestobacter italicus (strain DSM 44449 / CECT 9708 / BC 501) TaxID=2732864 RepID=UPI001C988CB4|nr:hypothetical protein [Modestobacter italicus]
MSRTTRTRPVRRGVLVSTLGVALLATACGRADTVTGSVAATTEAGGGHGYVAGAEELTEPQLRLSYLDGAGTAHSLDLLTGESISLGPVGAPSSVVSDGRFLFSASGGELTVVDTGTWTVDHGDHTHYYRAQPRVVGSLDWSGEVRVGSSEQTTTLFSPATGEGVVLDREALGQGEIERTASTGVSPHDGVLLPLGEHLIATDGNQVRALDAAGEPVEDASAPCPDVRGGAITRVGVVVSCADGAVLATQTDGGVAFESVPYPRPVGADERATAFAQRPGRPAVAGVAGARGVWLLDTRARSWQLIETPEPLVRAVAVDDDRDRVVALDTSGRLLVIEPEVGVVATTEPLAGAPADLAAMTVDVDAARAYVNVPSAGVVHEIDYADGARIARSLPTEVPPVFFAETGR